MNSNPFSTRYTKPGEIPFRFINGESHEELASRIGSAQKLQIVGAHGSGKSTLLTELIRTLRRNGTGIEHHILRAGQRKLSLQYTGTFPRRGQTISEGRPRFGEFDQSSPEAHDAKWLVVIDGYEQLSWWSRRQLLRYVKRTGQTLVVTTHYDVGFTMLYETKVNYEVLRDVLRNLVGDPQAQDFVSDEFLHRLLAKHGQNLREMLFELFDVWQSSAKSELSD